MVLPISLICRAKRVHEDGTATVFIQYCYKATNRTLLHTGIKIPPNYWDQKQRCVSEKIPAVFGNAVQLNKELRRQFRIVEDLVTYAIESNMTVTSPQLGEFPGSPHKEQISLRSYPLFSPPFLIRSSWRILFGSNKMDISGV